MNVEESFPDLIDFCFIGFLWNAEKHCYANELEGTATDSGYR